MRHKFAQHYKMLQKMVLTPQMKQSLQLLTMSTMDLHEYIETMLAANPFLKKSFTKRTDDGYDYVANIANKENPRAALLSQIRMLGLKGRELEIAEYLIYEMDDNGYITVNLDEMADSLSVDAGEIEKIIEVIQGLEPAGIGARDIRECLCLQLKRQKKENSLECRVVTDFISELAKNDITKISKALKINKEKIEAAINNIKKLNPRPASTMLSKETAKVIPDLIVETSATGAKNIALRLNREWLPQVEFHNPYEKQENIKKDVEAQKFIKENMDSAKGLVDGLMRREDTIYKVANYILNFQSDGLFKDGFDIKSLSIKDIAGILHMHSSTISRAISNKYIQIDNEVKSLKSLLSRAMKKSDGEITSKTAVLRKIQALIKNEDSKRPLTDERIKKELEREGILIKRRTIAKYRTAAGILPTHLRKKL